MIIKFTQYKNSKTATMIDFIGSGFSYMGVLMILLTILEVFTSGNLTDLFGMLLSAAVFICIGTGVKKIAKKIAIKKM